MEKEKVIYIMTKAAEDTISALMWSHTMAGFTAETALMQK